MSNKKFILNSEELGRFTCTDDPEGWDTTKKMYSRNPEFLGVFRKRTSTLKFIGDGLDYCIRLEALKGTEAVLTVIIMTKVDYQDAWELEYEGIGKFNPFDLEWGEDLSPELSIEFEDSGFHQKFLARAGMDINVGDETSVEGVNVGAMPTESIQVRQRTIVERNIFNLSANDKYNNGVLLPDEYVDAQGGHVVPVEKIEGDTGLITTPIDYLLSSPGMICDFVTQPTALKLTYDFAGDFNNITGVLTGWYVRVFHDAGDLSNFTDTILLEVPGTSPLEGEPFAFAGTLDISLNVGEAMSIVNQYDSGIPSDTTYITIYTKADLTIEAIQNFDEYVSNCHYRYEFMQRLVQIATDQVDCFKSSIFGRTDNGYLVNGQWWNNVVYNGEQLRGFTDKFPVRSFRKSFKSARSIWNVGCGIEKVGTRFKVVVEDLTYFFRGDISITLHNVTKIKRSVNKEFTFSEVRVGYEKAEYEQVNGLEEYNNKCVFATFIKSDDNILDLLSPDRADGYGREFARRKNIKIAATEDTPYDSEVWTEMVEKDGDLLRSLTDEGFSSVLNIQSPETASGLDITPQRNLIRNGDWINGCCGKYPTEVVKFLSADKATDLVSTKTGESAVSEQTSILNGDLKSSLWLNKNYLFEADITPAQVAAMELKPNSLIKFSPFSREQTKKYYYGWILENTVGGKERKGTFTLLAANINSDRLHIIDPDGIHQEDPTSPPTPTPGVGEDVGFEYSFEHVFEG